MLREYPRLGIVVTPEGDRLWATLERAHKYARVRVEVYGTRQRVTPEVHAGRLLWRVCPAASGRRKVGEPCS